MLETVRMYASEKLAAAAEAETVHAHAHLRVMSGVKTTAENLEAAIEGDLVFTAGADAACHGGPLLE